MTNALLDIQPALRPFNVLVRGGRLTKFKGRVASIAPGLCVVATAAVLFSGGAAHAANECGSVANNQVTCDADDNTANGITYNVSGTDDLTLILDDPDMTVGGSGARVVGSTSGEGDISMQLDNGKVITDGSAGFAPGLWAQINNTASTATARVRMIDGEINTTGANHHGILADNKGLGDAIAQMSGGKITTSGGDTYGLWANVGHAQSTASATASVTGGEINVGGTAAIFARNQGLGAATASLQNAKVITAATGRRGLWVEITNAVSEAMATGEVINGEISTTSDGSAYGIWVDQRGLGGALVSVERSTVTTIGDGAFGVWSELRNGDNTATSEARVINGHVTTRGFASTAVLTTHHGSGDSIVRAVGDTTITTHGGNSHGLAAFGNVANKAIVELGAGAVVRVYGEGAVGIHAEGGTGFDVDVAGSVTGGAGDGAAIRAFFLGSPEGTIDIASTGKVMAGGSGIAIRADDDGSAVINSAGIIEGDIRLGAGNDILTLTGGSFTGDLDAGDGNDTVTISSAASFDFSHVLDGGSGDNDQLTLHGQTISNTANNFLNWERVALNDTTLSLSGVTAVDMDLSIDAGSVFRAFGGNGGMTIAGDKVTNEGDVVFSVQDGTTGDVIRVEGNYTGSDTGSDVFALDTHMDGTDTDTLHFMGDVTGDMELSIASLGGGGAGGAPLEVGVVTVDGASDDATFTLMEGNHVMSDGEHGVIAGAYLYRLAETDSGWALSALSEDDEISWQPASPLYDSYGAALLAFTAPASLRNRGSAQDFRSLAWDGGAGADTAGQDTGSPLWVQMGTEQITSSEENSTTGAALESGLWEMEMGADIVLNDSAAGLLVGGLMLSYATGSTDVSSDFGDGSIDTTGLGLGLSATWYDTRGFYVDGQLTWTSYSSDLSSDSLGSLTEGHSGTGYALSIEAGQRLDLGSRLTVIPQAQLSLSSVTFSDFTSERREGPQGEAQQEQVALREATSQRLRLGLEFGEQDPGASGLYGMVNLFHEFGAGSEVEVDGASLTTEHEPWAVGVGLGGTYAWSDRVDLFGEASYATGLSNAGETSTLSASAGLKVVF